VVKDGTGDGPKYSIRNIRWPRDLEKMSTGMNHEG